MKRENLKYWLIGMLCFGIIWMQSCKDKEDPIIQVEEILYELGPVSDPDISGTILFRKVNETTTLVIIQLTGTTAGNSHPTHIHANSSAEGGPIVVDLDNVDGGSGTSETQVTMRRDGSPISYDDLIEFDGHANVHMSSSNLGTLIAQGNIGSNSSGISD